MRVYTHYYEKKENKGLRWRTLLQFGKSWDIIGSVVMKNPGSSKQTAKDTHTISKGCVLSQLLKYDNIDTNWYEFTSDDTMRKVSVLFASYYGLDNVNQLNGVIQIFNLFYVMDADEERAEQKILDSGLPANFYSDKDLLDYDINHLVPPVYLGFGDLARKDPFTNRAKRYFDTIIEKGYTKSYLKETFREKSFYHPQYLCGSGCNNQTSVYIRGKFKKTPLSDEEIKQNGVILPRLALSKEEKLQILRVY